ncbi:MAG TPA: cation:proton antiporter [Vicinamibacterales bacterium]|nr:cation:proton antiporter [Vicinamibacterales bacterium]
MKAGAVARVALVTAGALLLGAGMLLSRAPSTHIDELGWLTLGLAILVTAALIGGHTAARLGQAAVLGELLAGVTLGALAGPLRLQFIATDPFLDILARIGMLLLMFEVGLDLSVRDLFAVGPSALLVAVIGTAASLAIGTGAATLLTPAAPQATHIFIGAALTATSVGITARVLKDLGASRRTEARVVLGAAVVDDVLGLVVLGIVAAWFAPRPGAAGPGDVSIAALIMKTVGFLVLAIVLGSRLTPSWFRQAARLRTKGALLGVGLCFCFFLSWAANSIGLAALVGAFAAGLVLEDTHSEMFVRRGERPLGELLEPMTSFLVPVFFVLVGFRVDLRALTQPATLAAPLALTVAAIAGKLCCSAGVLAPGASRLTVAIGMIPRGEVALVFAALGGTFRVQGAPLLDQHGYAAIVAVVILTTLLTPPALKWSLRSRAGDQVIPRPAA